MVAVHELADRVRPVADRATIERLVAGDLCHRDRIEHMRGEQRCGGKGAEERGVGGAQGHRDRGVAGGGDCGDVAEAEAVRGRELRVAHQPRGVEHVRGGHRHAVLPTGAGIDVELVAGAVRGDGVAGRQAGDERVVGVRGQQALEYGVGEVRGGELRIELGLQVNQRVEGCGEAQHPDREGSRRCRGMRIRAGGERQQRRQQGAREQR